MEIVTINNDKQSLNNVSLGKNTRIFNFVNAYGCSIATIQKIVLCRNSEGLSLEKTVKYPAIVLL